MQSLSRKICVLSNSVYRRSQPFIRQLSGTIDKPEAPKPKSKCDPQPDHCWHSNPVCNEKECPKGLENMDEVCPPEITCRKESYTLTWAECPPRLTKQIPFCEDDKEPVYTPRLGKPRSTAKQGGFVGDEKCLKIRMPGCKEVREIVKCKRTRNPSDCVPIPAPCLSYSECEKDPPPNNHPNECKCWCKQCEPTDL